MTNPKPLAGQAFPKITLSRLGGGTVELGTPANGHDWQMIVIYRGKHCPICTRYLKELEEIAPELSKIGVDLVAASADPEERARAQTGDAGVRFPVGIDLGVDQMRKPPKRQTVLSRSRDFMS